MIANYDDAAELLRTAKMTYRELREYREALGMYRELAFWVTSERTQKTVPAEQLAELTREVRRGIAGFQSCDDECVWESASSLHDLFER